MCLAFDLRRLPLQAKLLLILPILQTLVLQAYLRRGHRVPNRILAGHELVLNTWHTAIRLWGKAHHLVALRKLARLLH